MKKKQTLKKLPSNQLPSDPIPTITSSVQVPRISIRSSSARIDDPSLEPQTNQEDDPPSSEPIEETKKARIESTLQLDPDMKIEKDEIEQEEKIEEEEEEIIESRTQEVAVDGLVPSSTNNQVEANLPVSFTQNVDTTLVPNKPIESYSDFIDPPPTLLPNEIGNPLFGLRRTFPALLYKILLTQHDTSIIDWNADGKSFIIKKPILFAQCIAPHYFNRKFFFILPPKMSTI